MILVRKALICGLLLFVVFGTLAQSETKEQHIRVALRLIGDQLLLNAGDSLSRVLPIEKEGDRYKIQFESDFYFVPEKMVTSIDSLVRATDLAEDYLVEINECSSDKVVYSYEIRESDKMDIIPCKTRMQPRGCYVIYISFMQSSSSWPLPLSIGFLVIMIGLVVARSRNRANTHNDQLQLGAYLFDAKGHFLRHGDEKIVLSSKEADLLYLLYTNENETLEREVILKQIWGDEGDYIGRTLDVFVSKLRKKLASDERLKIINVRGVGYKFVIA